MTCIHYSQIEFNTETKIIYIVKYVRKEELFAKLEGNKYYAHIITEAHHLKYPFVVYKWKYEYDKR